MTQRGIAVSTSDAHAHPSLKPLRVALRKEAVFEEARNLASELPGWKLLSADERALVVVCERRGALLGPCSTVTITVSGPEGLPSAEVQCRSASSGGPFARDRRNVIEFMTPLQRRVC